MSGGLLSPSSPVFCIVKYRGGVRKTEGLKIPEAKVIELALLSPCVPTREYRESARRAKGLEYKEEPPIPPLSGGEDARKTEEKGRGLSERSEFRRPRRRP